MAVGQMKCLRACLLGALALQARAITLSDSGSLSWLELPKGPNATSASAGLATYVGKSKAGYVDSAVLLGISLQRLLPDFPRFCLTASDVDEGSKGQLAAAGWTLVPVEEGNEHADTCAYGTPCREFYNKMNVFRLPLERLVWLDADMLVVRDGLRELLLETKLPDGHVAMVKDCCSPVFNSGLMLLRPSLEVFGTLARLPMGKKLSDQDLVNSVFAKKVMALDAKFNTHGYKTAGGSCDAAIVAHYTGLLKPTYPDAAQLELVRKGQKAKQLPKVFYNFHCDNLYKQYYCFMKENAAYLSAALQYVLGQMPACEQSH